MFGKRVGLKAGPALLWQRATLAVGLCFGWSACGDDANVADTPFPDDIVQPPGVAVPAVPTLGVAFPPDNTLTDDGVVTLRGTASASAGIRTVRVAGVEATSSDAFVNWEVVVNLSAGENVLEIVAEAQDGTSSAPVTRRITQTPRGSFLSVPTGLELNAAGTMAYLSDFVSGEVIGVDMVTGERSLVAGPTRGTGDNLESPTDLTLDESGGFLYAVEPFRPAIVRVGLATGDRSIVSDASVGTGTALAFPLAVELDAANSRVLVLDATLDALVAVDISSGDRTVISDGVIGSGPGLVTPSGLRLENNGQSVLVVDQTADALFRIQLSDGTRTLVSSALGGSPVGGGPAFESPIRVDINSSNTQAYITDFGDNAVYGVTLATGDRRIVSDANRGTGPAISTPRSVAFDVGNSRLLVAEEFADSPLAVDVSTGNRSSVQRIAQGSGAALREPVTVISDAVDGGLWVLDANAASLSSVQLGVGDRNVVSAPNSNPPVGLGDTWSRITDLVPDLTPGRVLVIEWGPPGELFAVNVSTGDRSAFPAGSGAPVNAPLGMTMDTANGRILVVDTSFDAVTAWDLNTNERTTLSRAAGVVSGIPLAAVGTGPAFEEPEDIVMSSDGLLAYVADSSVDAIVQVDLVTGDRTIIASDAVGTGDTIASPVDLTLDAAASQLYVLDAGDGAVAPAVVALDLAVAGARRVISSASVGDGPNWIAPSDILLADGILYVTDTKLRAVLAVDPITGSRVIVSR